MRKIKFAFGLTVIGVLFLCFSKNEHPAAFKIKGTITGYPDSTVLFLEDAASSQPALMDSTYILHGKFEFSGSVKGKVIHAVIRTKHYEDYKFFWLENNLITMRCEKGKFRQAVLAGSGTQTLQDGLDSAARASGNEKQQDQEFIRHHPTSIISAYILSVYGSSWGKDTTAMLYDLFSKELKNTSYGKDILSFITLNKNLKIGDQYADFSQTNTHGEVIKLSDFKGKLVLLDFWGSWCGPCRQENHELVKIYRTFRDKGFEILGVAADAEKSNWLDAVRTDSLDWQNVTDLKGDKNEAALMYGVSYYPASFLIDRDGTIIAKDLRGDQLKEKLQELLK